MNAMIGDSKQVVNEGDVRLHPIIKRILPEGVLDELGQPRDIGAKGKQT